MNENIEIETKEEKKYSTLPIIILHEVVGFPGCSLDFDIIGGESEKSVNYAEKNNSKVYLLAEDDWLNGDGNGSLSRTGVIAEITQHMKTSDRVNRISVKCYERAEHTELYRLDDDNKKCMCCDATVVEYTVEDDDSLQAESRNIKKMFQDWAGLADVSKEVVRLVKDEKNVLKMISRIIYCGAFSTETNQKILDAKTLNEALTIVAEGLLYEIHVSMLQRSLARQAEMTIENDKREMIIREQINMLSSQLKSSGDSEDDEFEDRDYNYEIRELHLDSASEKHLMKEANNLTKLPPMSQEYSFIRGYLDTVLSLPWSKTEIDDIDIEKAEDILENQHYGLEKIKERIVETLAVQKVTGKTCKNILCLVGPPGTGKTSVAKSIAVASGRKYVRVSLGGVHDEADIRGHRRTYLGSMPGRIINALIEAETNSPLILLDEIDKIGQDIKGDPASALLEVLDSEQNVSFRDHYIEVPFDLSNVMFVATANDLSTIPAPLLDRMEIVELSSYTREEKFHIAKDYLVPKQLKENGLTKTKLKISDEVIYELIDSYTREAGVRTLERKIASICRKADKRILEGKAKTITMNKKRLEEFLGARKYTPDIYMEDDTVGTVNGLAWTSAGGVLLPVEAMILKGKGRIQLTGSLGDVMQESAKIAITYARGKSDEYGFADDFIDTSDIHIHAPEGAVPKDGPSAGVTMTTALISALSGKKVRKDVAMTGEITLHGDVLPIGGLREKTMAAYKAGIKTVIVPFKNKPDMEEVDETVKENVDFVFAKNLDDVLSVALR